MKNYLADVGVNLATQFRDMCSVEDIIFSTQDVVRVIKKIDMHKSSGIDCLPTFILKDCFEVIVDQLTYLFNQSMKMGIFPES